MRHTNRGFKTSIGMTQRRRFSTDSTAPRCRRSGVGSTSGHEEPPSERRAASPACEARGRQGAVVSRRQAYALGITRWEVRAHVRARRWQLVGDQSIVLHTGEISAEGLQVGGRLPGRTARPSRRCLGAHRGWTHEVRHRQGPCDCSARCEGTPQAGVRHPAEPKVGSRDGRGDRDSPHGARSGRRSWSLVGTVQPTGRTRPDHDGAAGTGDSRAVVRRSVGRAQGPA